jgi:hypothetical protein
MVFTYAAELESSGRVFTGTFQMLLVGNNWQPSMPPCARAFRDANATHATTTWQKRERGANFIT